MVTITGPTGGAGSSSSTISVNENQTTVTKFTANELVAWSLSGNDAGKFQISPNGTLTFIIAPDFEDPTDRNNTYIVTITATDANGNASIQTLTVYVLNLDDTAPVITGPSGSAGVAASAISVNENQTAVTKFTANDTVTWSITGGTDVSKFQISADGTLTFVTPPDYENPTDAGTNNTYVVTITATDANGNVSTQTLTVTITNILEINDTQLIGNSIMENNFIGDKIGELNTTDENNLNIGVEYQLLNNNEYFYIDGNILRAKQRFNYETNNNFNLNIKTIYENINKEKNFIISILDSPNSEIADQFPVKINNAINSVIYLEYGKKIVLSGNKVQSEYDYKWFLNNEFQNNNLKSNHYLVDKEGIYKLEVYDGLIIKSTAYCKIIYIF